MRIRRETQTGELNKIDFGFMFSASVIIDWDMESDNMNPNSKVNKGESNLTNIP